MPVVDYQRGSLESFSFLNNYTNNSKKMMMDSGAESCDSRRVKVLESRRKQRWVDPILTPPRSPASPLREEIPEPILDDIMELWEGAGIDELEGILNGDFKDEMNVVSALSELGELDMGFDSELLGNGPLQFPPGDSISDDEENILDRLLSYVSDNSPPPTNPPSPPGDAENYCGSSSSSTKSSQYDEGYIGEDLINEQPHIFDNPINSTEGRISLATNIFEEDLGIKNDCMWSDQGSLEHHHKDELFKEFGKTHVKIEADIDANEIELDWTDTFNNWNDNDDASSTSSSSNSPSSSDIDEKLSEEAEMIRHATFNDHSYATPYPCDTKNNFSKFDRSNLNSCFSKRKSNHSIPVSGIIVKQEAESDQQGGPKKTKILVPLKDLMESLQQKTFLVAPLGPGKKVIRLTGTETVKSMLGMNHFNQQSNLCRSSFNPNKMRMKKKQRIQREFIKQEFDSFISSASPLSPTASSTMLTPDASPIKPKKTKTHNNMERLRRIDLRNSFDNLKKLVPVLAKSAKCSKVEILRRAEEYVRGIRNLEKRLVKEESTLRSRNEALKVKLAQLQSQSA